MDLKMDAAGTLSMDARARGGAALRVTVHQANAGHVELGSLLEVSERDPGGGFHSVAAYSAQGFLSAADDNGTIALIDESGLTIEGHWVTIIGGWLVTLTEDLTTAHKSEGARR